MESKELLASLAQMEASLSEIDSARKQVESTVKASSELQKEVSEYVSSVKALCVSLQSWGADLKIREGTLSDEFEAAVSQVNSTCSEVISSFEAVVEKASADFKTKTDGTIEKFTEQNTILAERVKDLNALKDDIKKATSEMQAVKEAISQISKELKDSQDSQDVVLDDIKQKVSDLNETVKNSESNISKEVSQTKQALSEALGKSTEEMLKIREAIAQLSSDLNNSIQPILKIAESNQSALIQLSETCEVLKNEMSQKYSSLLFFTGQIKEAIGEMKGKLGNSENINRWIIIAGIVILAILQFIVK